MFTDYTEYKRALDAGLLNTKSNVRFEPNRDNDLIGVNTLEYIKKNFRRARFRKFHEIDFNYNVRSLTIKFNFTQEHFDLLVKIKKADPLIDKAIVELMAPFYQVLIGASSIFTHFANAVHREDNGERWVEWEMIPNAKLNISWQHKKFDTVSKRMIQVIEALHAYEILLERLENAS